MSDNVGLDAWLDGEHRAIKKHAAAVRWAFWVIAAATALSMFAMIALGRPPSANPFDNNPLYELRYLPLSVLIRGAFRLWRLRRAERSRTENAPVDESFLRDVVAPLSARCGVESVRVVIDRNSESYLPSVLANGTLVVSSRMVALSRTRTEVVQALLSHELAHLRAGDARLWSKISMWMEVINSVAIPSMLMFAALAAVVMPVEIRGISALVLSITVCSVPVLFWLRTRILALRARSEAAADLFAMRHVGENGIRAAISMFVVDDEYGIGVHPRKHERLAGLSNWASGISPAAEDKPQTVSMASVVALVAITATATFTIVTYGAMPSLIQAVYMRP